jgi:hypothetical protein
MILMSHWVYSIFQMPQRWILTMIARMENSDYVFQNTEFLSTLIPLDSIQGYMAVKRRVRFSAYFLQAKVSVISHDDILRYRY